jgi:hypothetical protein
MCFKVDPKKNFADVGIALILCGVIFLVYGIVGGVYNLFSQAICVAFPAAKAIGGLIIMGLGYLILELESLRAK